MGEGEQASGKSKKDQKESHTAASESTQPKNSNVHHLSGVQAAMQAGAAVHGEDVATRSDWLRCATHSDQG
jgi:hypothetical protein